MVNTTLQGTCPNMHLEDGLLSNYPIETAAIGTVLLRRGIASDFALYIEHGRAALGVMAEGNSASSLNHHVGLVEGPNWLDSAAATLNVPSAVDAVAQTAVQLRRIPMGQFRALLSPSKPSIQSILHSIARAALQQTELAVSRLSKDAEARCAEWLLNHAQPSSDGSVCVHLQQTKQAVAKDLGIVPETLSRVLADLRRRKIIDGRGTDITLSDVSSLNKLAGSFSMVSH